MNEAYLDNAATTRVDPRVVDAMTAAFAAGHGNASSVHKKGVQANLLIERARAAVAARMGAESDEIVFTSGGTEANHLALWGYLRAQGSGGELLVSAIEHPSLLHAAELLAELGVSVRQIPVDSRGMVTPDALAKLLSEQTRLVSVMHANNEVGTVQNISALAELCLARGVAFHCDATQTFGKLPIDLGSAELAGVTMLTASAHKIHGPKGSGALFVRRGTTLRPLLGGGGQENGRRAGTEALETVHGFGHAATLAEPADLTNMRVLRARLLRGLKEIQPGFSVNGDADTGLPWIVSATLPGCNAKELLFALSRQGVYVSTGSACTAGETTPSHVLLALGLSSERAQETIRLSFSRWTSEADIDLFLSVLTRHVQSLPGGGACVNS